MPELPEVETVVRDLRPRLVGRTVTAVRLGDRKLRRPWLPAWTPLAVGGRVTGVGRRGKWIAADLHSGRVLVAHLGMTGRLTLAAAADPAPDHLHAVFALDDGAELRFRDPRRFGSVELYSDRPAADAFLTARLGPEPDAVDPAAFAAAVRRTGRPLKAVLLDQKVVAGVGNIYADEALHRAGLHPERRGPAVPADRLDRLRAAVAEVIAEAIAGRGSTIRDYVAGDGTTGGFQDRFRVYGRTGRPCLTCRTPIAVAKVGGRSSHFCPQCQV